MTKATEELKREMYEALAIVKGRIEINYSIKDMLRGVDEFESLLEDCFESMCKDLKTSHEATGELAIQLSEMTAQRDTLRNKLQAFEFANQSAGELLRNALATVKRQRQFIRTLYASRKARKGKPATRIQSSQENVSESKCVATAAIPACAFEGLHRHYTGACPHCGRGAL